MQIPNFKFPEAICIWKRSWGVFRLNVINFSKGDCTKTETNGLEKRRFVPPVRRVSGFHEVELCKLSKRRDEMGRVEVELALKGCVWGLTAVCITCQTDVNPLRKPRRRPVHCVRHSLSGLVCWWVSYSDVFLLIVQFWSWHRWQQFGLCKNE